MEDLNKLLGELADIQKDLPDFIKEGDKGYGVLPVDWKDQHIISCLIRNIMIVDNNVSSDEESFMDDIIIEYTSEGTNLNDAWDDVDEYLVKLFDEDNAKYWKTIDDCENYIKQNYNQDQKNKLITALMNMASQDDVVEYSEFTMLKSAMDKWFPGSLNQMVETLKGNGITVITESKLPETDASEVTSDKENNWTIIHDLAVFYNYFGNLADGTMKNEEMKKISHIMPKWKFIIDNVSYGLICNNPSNLDEVMNLAYDEMYGSDGNKDPMDRVNQSQMNFVNYFNKGGILNGNIIGTFLNNLYEISNADGVISEGQDHQLRWYINQWKPVCKSAEKVEALLNIKKTQDNLKDSLVDQGVSESALNELNNESRKENEKKLEPEPSEDDTSGSSSLNVLDMSGSTAVQDLLAKVQAIVDEDSDDDEEAYGVLPSHWENKQIICCLLRHMMVIDDQVHDNERASMSQTIQKFTSEGIDLSGSWDDVDDYLVSLHGQDYAKYEQTVLDCEDYVNEHFEHDQKSAVLSAIMNMAAADKVLEDSELKMLKRIAGKWSVNYESMVDFMKSGGAKIKTSEDSDSTEKQEAQKEEPSVADSSEETSTEPVESSGDPVEDFRSFLASKYPTLKLPKGKKYVEFPIGKGMLVCCMVKTNGVNVYLYSGGKVPAREVFDKLNSLGVSGKVINDKYTITPMPGSRNPNVVRIDLLVSYDGRDLNSNELRDEVNDVYSQLLELCKPLA